MFKRLNSWKYMNFNYKIILKKFIASPICYVVSMPIGWVGMCTLVRNLSFTTSHYAIMFKCGYN